jgi:UDPglucose 6-dehydrogenase
MYHVYPNTEHSFLKKGNIAVIGMGYVGLTTALALGEHGYYVHCTSTTQSKVDALNRGVSPFWEEGIEELVIKNINEQTLCATTDNVDAIKNSDITIICVGTPSLPDGSADLSAVKDVSVDVGNALKEKTDYHVVVTKSTIVPGTTEEIIKPIIERVSGKTAGIDFGLCMNPEFLRQGSAVYDSLNPDRIVIGQIDKKSGDVLEKIYDAYDAEKIRCEIKAAELIKYASNSLLATKISFANEFSRICEKFNIDVYDVMKGVGLDFRINPMFLNAGCGFGGSCFPKDVNAIVALAKQIEVETPILDAVLYTNELQPMHLVNIIKEKIDGLTGKTAAFLGLSFKPNTDDTRSTRALPIVEALSNEGVTIKAYDPKATPKFKLLTGLPIQYMDSWVEALRYSDFVVIQSDWQEFKTISPSDFKELMTTPIVFDGRRTFNPETLINNGINYYGIGWKNQ